MATGSVHGADEDRLRTIRAVGRRHHRDRRPVPVAPGAAAAAYGLTTEHDGAASDPYLAAKGVRDIASGVAALVLLAAGKPHVLGRYLAAASIIPIGDAITVLRGDGAKATAYGVHGTTAAVMLGTAGLLLSGPE